MDILYKLVAIFNFMVAGGFIFQLNYEKGTVYAICGVGFLICGEIADLKTSRKDEK